MIKNLLYAILPLLFLISCNNPSNKEEKTEKDSQENSQVGVVQVQKVLGIGGVFFKSEDPVKMAEWFKENLGLNTNEYGSLFEFRLLNAPQKVGTLQWSPMPNNNNFFEPSTVDFMINYRVKDLQSLLYEFKEQGVTVLDTIETYEYGKFLHILDSENNKIELWEPVDSVFANLYKGTMNTEVGIGGIFFKSKNPQALKEWYKNILGLSVDEYGCMFSTRNTADANSVHYLQWSPFPDTTSYFAPSDKQLMINYRVKNIDLLVSKLRKNGVKILDELLDTEYGKFIHILGPENTKIELWEQPSVLQPFEE